jgi:hypothetical protein
MADKSGTVILHFDEQRRPYFPQKNKPIIFVLPFVYPPLNGLS